MGFPGLMLRIAKLGDYQAINSSATTHEKKRLELKMVQNHAMK